jgi:hypothetical protein
MVRAGQRFHFGHDDSVPDITQIESKQLIDVRRRVYNCR